MACSCRQGSYSKLGGLSHVETLVIVTAELSTHYTSMDHSMRVLKSATRLRQQSTCVEGRRKQYELISLSSSLAFAMSSVVVSLLKHLMHQRSTLMAIMNA